MTEQINDTIDKINNGIKLIEANYRSGSYSKTNFIFSETEEEALLQILSSEELFSRAFLSGQNDWYSKMAFAAIAKSNPRLGSRVIKMAIENEAETSSGRYSFNYGTMIESLLRSSSYEDISILNDVALNLNGPAQLFAAQYCTIDTLRQLRRSKDAKIREVVFSRLGTVECLDEMLDDKTKDIRVQAVHLAPMGYSRLSKMTKEISGAVFSVLIDKINISSIPMLLGNRNMKNKWIAKRLQARLDSGE